MTRCGSKGGKLGRSDDVDAELAMMDGVADQRNAGCVDLHSRHCPLPTAPLPGCSSLHQES
jgi:hypothetical protein